MKITYTRTQFWFNLKAGGSVGHTLGVLDGFRKNRCKLFVMGNEHFLGIDDFNHFIVKPKIKRPGWLGEFFYNFYAEDKFKKNILKFNPDFIYHRYTGYTFFVAKIAKELRIPLILEFNGFGTWVMKYWGKSRNFFKEFVKKYLLANIVKKIESYTLRNAFLIVAVSEPLKMGLLRMGIPEERIVVNPNGVDLEKFNPEVMKSRKCKRLKQDLGIDGNKVVIGFCGTFGPWHGIPQLTEAIGRISSERISNIRFLLIGEGPLKSEMERQIGDCENVKFTGEVPYSEIQYYLAICDVLVSPHNPQINGREFFGSPTKLFEYMAMGKGIVASNLGQIGDILKDGESAVLVEPGLVGGLVDGMLKLVKNEDLRERLGGHAREIAANYTWEKNVKRLLQRLV